ncbi:MAG: hypothetical protein KAT68_02285 [Bacteroidales bacterium]|nr:hypothetical protein [Bacteroidales bacterium]
MLKIKLLLYILITLMIYNKAVSQDGFYIPKPLITSINNQANQLQTSIGYGNGYFINASYSISKNISFIAGGFIQNETRKINTWFGDKRNLEINNSVFLFGLTYSKQFDFWKFNIFEITIGTVFSEVDNISYFIASKDSKLFTQTSYINVFPQFNLGIIKKKYKIIYSLRFSNSFYDEVIYYNSYSIDNKEKLNFFSILSIDPALSFNYTIIKNIEFISQVGVSVPLYKNKFMGENIGDITKKITISPLITSLYKLGILYKFNFKNE